MKKSLARLSADATQRAAFYQVREKREEPGIGITKVATLRELVPPSISSLAAIRIATTPYKGLGFSTPQLSRSYLLWQPVLTAASTELSVSLRANIVAAISSSFSFKSTVLEVTVFREN